MRRVGESEQPKDSKSSSSPLLHPNVNPTNPNPTQPYQSQSQLEKDETPRPSILLSALSATSLTTLQLLTSLGKNTISTTTKLLGLEQVLYDILNVLQNCYTNLTPERIQNWLRIVSCSARSILVILGRSEKGRNVGEKVRVWGASGVESLSSGEVRQVVVDGMAGVVKTVEALRTPESKAALEHCALLGCRIIDALSTHHVKQLLHDTTTVIWSIIELTADPNTTLAFAQITADLCHALESESFMSHHGTNSFHMGSSPNRGNIMSSTEQAKLRKRRAIKRRARQQYIHRVYTHGNDTVKTSDTDYDVGVEDVILSSLGDTPTLPEIVEAPANQIMNDGDDEDNHIDAIVTAAATAGKNNMKTSSLDSVSSIASDDNEQDKIDPFDTDTSSSNSIKLDGASNTLIPPGAPTTPDVFPNIVSKNADIIPNTNDSDVICDVPFLHQNIMARANSVQFASDLARRRGRVNTTNGVVLNENREIIDEIENNEKECDIEDLNDTLQKQVMNHTKAFPPKEQDDAKDHTCSLVQKAHPLKKRGTDHLIEYEEEAELHAITTTESKKRRNNNSNNTSSSSLQDRLMGMNSTSSQLFFHALDQKTTKRKKANIQSSLNRNDDTFVRADGSSMNHRQSTMDQDDILNDGHFSRLIKGWFPMAAAAAGSGNERGQDTTKQQYANDFAAARPTITLKTSNGRVRYRGSEIGVGTRRVPLAPNAFTSSSSSWKKKLTIAGFGILLCFILVVIFIWTVLGCYGFYVLVFGNYNKSAAVFPALQLQSLKQPEMIVKIIREVVYVKPDGTVVAPALKYSDEKFIINDAITAAVDGADMAHDATVTVPANGGVDGGTNVEL